MVKKPAFASLPWDQCEEKHVRLVTGFDPLNKFLKQIPPKAADPMMVYTKLANWKFLGELDFSDMYWQMPFNLASPQHKRQLEYLCIRTVFGTFTYCSGPMGLLGMDAIQEELTDKVLGDLVLAGKVAKVADNVYFGGQTLQDLLDTFHEILRRCDLANLRLKPSKINLNIQHADILGLHWNKGTLTPSAHRLEPLAECEIPKTVKGLRSFLGAVRFYEICLNSKRLAAATELLDEQVPATRSGKDEIVWEERTTTAFRQIQQLLRQPEVVYVPRQGDQLFLCGDGAPSGPALGTKLVIKRDGKLLPSFNYGFRLKNSMRGWSPCEFEAFSITQGIKKMKPFLRFVETPTTVLVDSKASVQAILRMENGQFSTNRRLQDLLANLSAERLRVVHMSAKIASPILHLVDFASRNPVMCTDNSCTICDTSSHPDITFFGQADISPTHLAPPPISVPVWKDIQRSSDNCKRAVALLESGKNLHKKETHLPILRSYLRQCTLSKEGLLVAKKDDNSQPFQSFKSTRIVVPQEFAYNFLTVLHRRFQHPSATQLYKLFNRYFFMLDTLSVIKDVTSACEYPCAAMKTVPKETLSFSTTTKPDAAGTYFNADVLIEFSQKILVVRDNLTSLTDALFITNEQKPTLRSALIVLTSRLRSPGPITIRTDPHSSFKSLKDDRLLSDELISLDIGSAKNVNKNAVAEKAIQELRKELLKVSPGGGKISDVTLAKAVSHLNNRIRHSGRTSRELWVRRDQFTNEPLTFCDSDLSDSQFRMRTSGHHSSALHESRHAPPVSLEDIRVGDKVFIKSDHSKSKVRDPYFVLSLVPDKKEARVQKIADTANRQNVLIVQLQNLYRAPSSTVYPSNPSFSDPPSSSPPRSPPSPEPPPPSTTPPPTLPPTTRPPSPSPNCFYCLRMQKPSVNHSSLVCPYLCQVRLPTHQPTSYDSSSSQSDDDNPLPPPPSPSHGSTRDGSIDDSTDISHLLQTSPSTCPTSPDSVSPLTSPTNPPEHPSPVPVSSNLTRRSHPPCEVWSLTPPARPGPRLRKRLQSQAQKRDRT